MQNSSPLVTVLLPCYNSELYIEKALKSIIDQSYSNLEILCVNDGSTDNSINILNKYQSLDNRIKIFNNKSNIGLIKTLNNSLQFVSGNFIARMDADDYSHPDRIKLQMDCFFRDPTLSVISTNAALISPSGKLISTLTARQRTYFGCFFASFFYVPFHHGPMIIRTEVLKKYKFKDSDEAIHTEDYELFSRMLSKKEKVEVVDIPLYDITINPHSVSRKYTSIQDENFLKCAKMHFENYTKTIVQNNIFSIIVNRIELNLCNTDVVLAFYALKKFKKFFLTKESDQVSKIEKKEIDVVYYTQLFDISIQIIKKLTFICKLYSICILLWNLKMFFNKEVRNYIKAKF